MEPAAAATEPNQRALITIIIILLLVIGIGAAVYAINNKNANTSNNGTSTITPTPTPSSVTVTTSQTVTANPTLTSLSVSSVDLAVSPNSISNIVCGSSLTVTYTATFHIPAGSQAGTISFMWTANNGRSSTNVSLPVAANETTKTYTFTTSGTATQDHTYPGIAQVLVTSPNSIKSAQVQPTGQCH